MAARARRQPARLPPDNYTVDFAYGFIMYAVVQRRLKIIMLRIGAPGY